MYFKAFLSTPTFFAAVVSDSFLDEQEHTSAVCVEEPQMRHLLLWHGQFDSECPACPQAKQWPAAMSLHPARVPVRSGAERLRRGDQQGGGGGGGGGGHNGRQGTHNTKTLVATHQGIAAHGVHNWWCGIKTSVNEHTTTHTMQCMQQTGL